MTVILKAIATSAAIFVAFIMMGATPEPRSESIQDFAMTSAKGMKCYSFVIYDDSQTRMIAAMGSDGKWTIPGPLSDLEASARASTDDIRSCVLGELVKRRPTTGSPDTDCLNPYDWRSDPIVRRCVPSKYLSDGTIP